MKRSVIFASLTLGVAALLSTVPTRAMMPLPRPIPAPPGPGWVWIPPVYRTVVREVWVPPTTRTVYDRVWTGPVYQTVTDRVWVPDQYGWRKVTVFENGQSVERYEWVLTAPGHHETCTRQVLVSSGGWSYVPRQEEITPGHYERRAVQEMVTPGHWEYRGPGPVPMPPLPPLPGLPPVPPVTGGRPPGLEPFSPLWDWPADTKAEKKQP